MTLQQQENIVKESQRALAQAELQAEAIRSFLAVFHEHNWTDAEVHLENIRNMAVSISMEERNIDGWIQRKKRIK